MMPFWNALRGELVRCRRLLLDSSLIALLLLALLGSIAAYQVRRPLFVDVGGLYDAPYLADFHAPEPDRRQVPEPEEDYRWTREWAEVHLLGLGRQPVEVRLRLQAYRPAGLEAPQMALWAGGANVVNAAVPTIGRVYTVMLPADLLAGGNLHMALHSDTFQPAGDSRELGLSLDWIGVRPAGVGWVGPAWPQVGCVLGVALLGYLLLRRWGLGRAWSSGLVALSIALLSYLLAFHRLSLTYFTPTLVLLLAWGLLLTVLGLPLLEHWRRRGGGTLAEARWLWVLLLLGVLLRLGGMLYPQFRSSDLIFHAHRAEWVAGGLFYFTADLPDVNLPAPYPPGLYVTMLPATLLSLDVPLLMEIVGVILDALCGLLLYTLARHLTGRPRAALLALLLQEVAPVTYWIYSWGNYTNLFSRVGLLASLLLLCLGHWRHRGVRDWLLLGGAFSLVLLGHFADSLVFGGFVLTTAALSLLAKAWRRSTAVLLGVLLAAGALALGLYYSAPPGWEALLGGMEVLLGGEGRPAVGINPLGQFVSHVQAPLLLLALPGLALLPRRVWRWSIVPLGGALLTAAAFAAGQALFGLSARYSLFVLPVLALGAGHLLDLLWPRGRGGRAAVGALLAGLVWTGLWGWEQGWWWIVRFGQR